MTVGEIVAVLRRKDPGADVSFDFVYFRPMSLHSYRGYYEQLALGYGNEGTATVGDVLGWFEDAIGKTFTGYKGGEYTMGTDTPVWVANHDEAGSTAVVDIKDDGMSVRLITGIID